MRRWRRVWETERPFLTADVPELLKDGWEPFAVTPGGSILFRRRRWRWI